MPARKMRVELFDNEGNKYTVSFEGQITRDKALRLLDLLELLGGVQAGQGSLGTGSGIAENELSKYGRLRTMLQRHFPIVWFSSREVQSVYEQEFKQPISLSTVATYLLRLAGKGVLLRNGPANNLRYKVVPATLQANVKTADVVTKS